MLYLSDLELNGHKISGIYYGIFEIRTSIFNTAMGVYLLSKVIWGQLVFSCQWPLPVQLHANLL